MTPNATPIATPIPTSVRTPAVRAALCAAAALSLGACTWLSTKPGEPADAPPSPAATFETAAAAAEPAMVAPASAPVEVPRNPTIGVGTREIDRPVIAQSVAENSLRGFPEGAGAVFAKSPVPVLAPAGLTDVQKATFASTFRTLPNGYFGRVRFDQYDVIVNGTASYAVAPAGATVVTRPTGSYLVEFGSTGATVAFNRFGADYLVEIECLGAVVQGNSCIEEADAATLAEGLTLIGGAQ